TLCLPICLGAQVCAPLLLEYLCQIFAAGAIWVNQVEYERAGGSDLHQRTSGLGVVRENVPDPPRRLPGKPTNTLISTKGRTHRARGRLPSGKEPHDLVLVGGHVERITHQSVIERRFGCVECIVKTPIRQGRTEVLSSA